MSHRKNYRVIVPPRQSVPKRLLFRRTILAVKSTTDRSTASAVQDELSAHEEVYFADDCSIEHSTGDYNLFTYETLSLEVG